MSRRHTPPRPSDGKRPAQIFTCIDGSKRRGRTSSLSCITRIATNSSSPIPSLICTFPKVLVGDRPPKKVASTRCQAPYELIDKDADYTHSIYPRRSNHHVKWRALPTIRPFHKALHPNPRKAPGKHSIKGVFTQPGSGEGLRK
jgi:hypothetical protein